MHAIANFKARAKISSVVETVDEIRRLFALSAWAGTQRKQKGHSPGKMRRGRNNPPAVDVYWMDDKDRQRRWLFYVRNGKVLLTVRPAGEKLDDE